LNGKAWDSSICNGLGNCYWNSSEYSGKGKCVDVIIRNLCSEAETLKECLLVENEVCRFINGEENTKGTCEAIDLNSCSINDGNSELCDAEENSLCLYDYEDKKCVVVIGSVNCDSSNNKKECLLAGGGKGKCIWNSTGTVNGMNQNNIKCRPVGSGCSDGSKEKAWDSNTCNSDESCYWDSTNNGKCVEVIQRDNCESSLTEKECLLSIEGNGKCIWNSTGTRNGANKNNLKCRPSGSGCSDGSKEKAWDSSLCDSDEVCYWDSSENGKCVDVIIKNYCIEAINEKECLLAKEEDKECKWESNSRCEIKKENENKDEKSQSNSNSNSNSFIYLFYFILIFFNNCNLI
jgi:hypothetical protein